MKTLLQKSFYASRVGEALDSLAEYARQARDVANDIKPVETSEPPLTSARIHPQPRIGKVESTSSGYDTHLEISGQHLENIEYFRLIPADDFDDNTYQASRKVPPILAVDSTLNPPQLDVTFAGELPPGAYHAWVRDDFGQEDLLVNALIVPEPATVAAVAPAGTVSCEIAAVVPSEAVVIVPAKTSTPIPHKVFVEVTSKGDRFPADVSFQTSHPHIRCESSIPTADPKVRLLPITICSAPAKGTSIRAEIKARTVSTGSQEGTFEFSILQP